MSRDYKPKSNGRPARGGSMFAGILIGLILGIGISLGVAWYINKMPSPFVNRNEQTENQPAKIPPPKPDSAQSDNKPKFDFYKILPGQENPAPQNAAPAEPAAPAAPAAPAVESYYLQAGAFQKREDADNMKAKLAMLGLESEIQTGSGADSKYRVRIGTYQNQDDLGKAQEELKQNGIAASVVKIKETSP